MPTLQFAFLCLLFSRVIKPIRDSEMTDLKHISGKFDTEVIFNPGSISKPPMAVSLKSLNVAGTKIFISSDSSKLKIH